MNIQINRLLSLSLSHPHTHPHTHTHTFTQRVHISTNHVNLGSCHPYHLDIPLLFLLPSDYSTYLPYIGLLLLLLQSRPLFSSSPLTLMKNDRLVLPALPQSNRSLAAKACQDCHSQEDFHSQQMKLKISTHSLSRRHCSC